MRRFEHENGRFWSIDDDTGRLIVRWGQQGEAGQKRELGEGNLHAKKVELIAKQLALGYVEVMSVGDLVASMQEDVRWYRKLALADRSVAVAIDGRHVYTWRDGEREPKDDREFDFGKAKEKAAEILSAAIARGMVITDELEPVDDRDPILRVRVVLNPELEAQCRAALNDPGPWSVYADWLMTENDVRGELAALRASGKEEAANALLKKCRTLLFDPEDGAVADAVEFTSWRYGFPSGATITTEMDGEDLHELTAKFLALPIAVFIDELRFGIAGWESNNDWRPTLAAVTEAKQAKWLRGLRFDNYTYADQEISWTAFGDFTGAWELLPALEDLRIRSGKGGTLGVLDLPNLKKFVRVSGGLSEVEIKTITTANWPQLEHLEIWFGRNDYGAQGTASMLAPTVDANGLPKLRHLGIVNCEFSLAAIERLVGSRLLPQLTSLDLSNGVMMQREHALLIEHAAAFAHLTSIDVSENYFTEVQLAMLRRALPNIFSRSQREYGEYEEAYDEDTPEEDREDYRYAALGE